MVGAGARLASWWRGGSLSVVASCSIPVTKRVGLEICKLRNRHPGRRGSVAISSIDSVNRLTDSDVDFRFTELCGQAISVCRISPDYTVVYIWLWMKTRV